MPCLTSVRVFVFAVMALIAFITGFDLLRMRFAMGSLDTAGHIEIERNIRSAVHNATTTNHSSSTTTNARQDKDPVPTIPAEVDPSTTAAADNGSNHSKQLRSWGNGIQKEPATIGTTHLNLTREDTDTPHPEGPDDNPPQPQQQQIPLSETEGQDPTTNQTTESAIPAHTAEPHDTVIVQDDSPFDPKLTAEDLAFLEPSIPSKEWLQSCATTLAKDRRTIVVPFPTLRQDYALGDCIKACNKCNLGLPGKQKTIRAPNWKHDKNYKMTIAGYYNELACPTNIQNYTIVDQLLDIFGQREGFVKPHPNDIVMHLRLGDVMEKTQEDVGTLLVKGGVGDHPGAKGQGLKTIRSVFDYLEELKDHPNSKVVIVGGSHKREFYEKSRVYANCLQRGLAKAGRVVELKLDGGDADKDFYFMCFAKKYILSTGGFSRFMGAMAMLHGGEIIGNQLDFAYAMRKWDFIANRTFPSPPTEAPASYAVQVQEQELQQIASSAREEEARMNHDIEPVVVAAEQEPGPNQTTESTIPADTSAAEPQVAALVQDDTPFDQKLTAEDLAFLEPSIPSKEWLQSCATTLAKDRKNIVIPFPTLRQDYALGDCIKACNKCNLGLPGKQKTIRAPNWKHDKNYKMTIAGYYNELACPTNIQNYTIVDQLLDIFGQREGFVKPHPNDIVMHLRLGDVMEKTTEDVGTLLVEGGVGDHPGAKGQGLKTIRSVYDYLEELKDHPNSKVVIVGGSHKREFYEKSRVYANCLQRGLAKAGRVVELKLDGGDADKDFYFMCFAKKYILSTGGFSRFMGAMAMLHGGEIIGNQLDFAYAMRKWDFIANRTLAPAAAA